MELHLIGPLQTNKAKAAVALFDVIQTVDRPKLAGILSDEMSRTGRRRECYVEVNVGEEPRRAGVPPMEADRFIAECRERYQLPVRGVMCIPPFDQEPSPYFALLAKIAERNGLPSISMGMSGDYDIAVAFGATHVRVGTAIVRSPRATVMRRGPPPIHPRVSDFRISIAVPQYGEKIVHRQRDASRRRGEPVARDVQKDRAAQARRRRPVVVADHRDDVVDVIVTP